MILCAPDSFKDCMSSVDAAAAMARGVRSVRPDVDVVQAPLADGGEGTASVLHGVLGGRFVDCAVSDPLGRPTSARFLQLPDGRAIVEVAAAVGVEGLAPEERDAMATTSRGVGELILAALDAGATHIIVTLGGSATNDAGSGLLSALGVRFLDSSGHDLASGGAALRDLAAIDAQPMDQRVRRVRFTAATDVTNPLLGPAGASAVFGPQKGATPSDVAALDEALANWAHVVESVTGRSVADRRGAGAAGGMGAALMAFLDAEVVSGADFVMDALGIDSHLDRATLVLTGEGSWDGQSSAGKAPAALSSRAAVRGVPTVVLAGHVAAGTRGSGVLDAIQITAEGTPLDRALAEGPSNLERATAEVVRCLTESGMVF